MPIKLSRSGLSYKTIGNYSKGFVRSPLATTRGSIAAIGRIMGPIALAGATYTAAKNIITASRLTNAEIESQHSPERNRRHAQLLAAIRKQRKK